MSKTKCHHSKLIKSSKTLDDCCQECEYDCYEITNAKSQITNVILPGGKAGAGRGRKGTGITMGCFQADQSLGQSSPEKTQNKTDA